MQLTTRVEPIDRDIAVILQQDLSPRARSAALAEIARGALADGEEQDREAIGYVPPHQTFVDGTQTDDLESVRPDGTIVFTFDIIEQAFAWIDDQLIIHSPIKSGAYERAHLFLADGVEADPQAMAPKASEYVFINNEPYARKIERGESPQAPEGVYEAVATLAKSRFSHLVKVGFEYRELVAGAVNDWALIRQPHRGGRSRRAQLTQDRRQPAIVLTPR